ncbi:MAG: sigma-70 family RNA polymerase sigma factor [Planctomycetes bacterium]|nr:sigma-70 family RNA polymerase sigma factor [Planctomycetota bacterium]
MSDPREQFVADLTDAQGRIAAYIRTLIPDHDRAKDVLQETNLVLWRKADEFTPGTEFGAWACKVAYFQVLAHRRDSGREQLLFDDELVGQVAATAERRGELFDQRQRAMRGCLKKLDARQREAIHAKYSLSLPIADMAVRFSSTSEAVKKLLFRARRALFACIERSISQEGQR